MNLSNTAKLTVLGLVGGVFNYATHSGFDFPKNKSDLMALGLSVTLAAMGYLSRGVASKLVGAQAPVSGQGQ